MLAALIYQSTLRPVVAVVSQGGREKTLLERELERKKLFRKKKIKFALPPEERAIVEAAVQLAATTQTLDDGPAPSVLLARARYLETLARGLEQTERLNSQLLSELWDADVASRKEETFEEEAIAILAAWWMNEG